MYPASTIKAFVMASVYDQIRQGKMQYSSGVYSLLWDMITVSDNECYNGAVMAGVTRHLQKIVGYS